MVQRVTSLTRRRGGTLDVIITHDDYVPDDITVDPPGVMSDQTTDLSAVDCVSCRARRRNKNAEFVRGNL